MHGKIKIGTRAIEGDQRSSDAQQRAEAGEEVADTSCIRMSSSEGLQKPHNGLVMGRLAIYSRQLHQRMRDTHMSKDIRSPSEMTRGVPMHRAEDNVAEHELEPVAERVLTAGQPGSGHHHNTARKHRNSGAFNPRWQEARTSARWIPPFICFSWFGCCFDEQSLHNYPQTLQHHR